MGSWGCLLLAGRDIGLRPLCYADCATVEERPFQGRVRKWGEDAGFSPRCRVLVRLRERFTRG
jgi:cbb3-type cytochrome oxidase cytochrome c subunit